jgi:hypothetical protein
MKKQKILKQQHKQIINLSYDKINQKSADKKKQKKKFQKHYFPF